MTLRDDLIPVIDDARQLIDDFGLRRFTVVVRKRTWSGGQLGLGTATNVDLTLSPKPKVGDVPENLAFGEPGKYETGDRLVRKISASYTRAQLDGGTLAAGEELVWMLDDIEYSLVEVAEHRNFEWRALVRRRNRRRP